MYRFPSFIRASSLYILKCHHLPSFPICLKCNYLQLFSTVHSGFVHGSQYIFSSYFRASFSTNASNIIRIIFLISLFFRLTSPLLIPPFLPISWSSSGVRSEFGIKFESFIYFHILSFRDYGISYIFCALFCSKTSEKVNSYLFSDHTEIPERV